MGEFIAKQKQHFPVYKDSDSKMEYHALTRGLIINEIVRRIDKKVRIYQNYEFFENTWQSFIK